MDDSLFARLGYDPVRIFTHIHGCPPPPCGIARFRPAGSPPEPAPPPEPPPQAEEEPSPEPAPPEQPFLTRQGSEAAEGADDPILCDRVEGHGDGAAASDPDDAARGPATPTPAVSGSPSPGETGQDAGALPAERPPHELVVAWMNAHWDTIEAMARAGEAPQRPPPPPPPEPPGPPDGPGDPTPPRPVNAARGDRWTKWKMAEFLRHLAATHSVTAAAKAVGMSRNSAYKLRSRLKGQPFDIAWEAAFRHGFDELAHAALELALEGEEVPHYHKGELVGTHRKRNPQLMVQLLRMCNRAGAPMLGRYNAAAEYWSEHWEQLIHRVATGAVTWQAEHDALSDEGRAALDLPDEGKQITRIIERNWPDEPRGPGKP